MSTLATNLATGLNYRFILFSAMDKTVTTTYRNVFGTSGKVYSITINNSTGSPDHGLIKLFDTTAALTVSGCEYAVSPSAVIPFSKADAAPTPDTIAFTQIMFPEGLEFSNGLGIAISKDVSTSYGIKAANALAEDVTSVVIAYK
tara:strand:+ start:533 stop:967 length:435 start_codon:yes stop_codon:yes gene_type:complete